MNIDNYITSAEKFKEEFELFKTKFFPVLMRWEGGGKLHKVSNDPGGWTIWGIAWNLWGRIFDSFEDFKDTTYEEACYLAFGNFYLPIKAHLMPHDIKLYYMDMAYNMGARQAIKILQRCAGVKADGIIGPITLAAAQGVKEECLKRRRDNFYYRLVERKHSMSKFLRGWLNRSNGVYKVEY